MLKANGEGSSFSKVAFVADGQQIDMDDPDFWRKMLPKDEADGGGEEGAPDDEYGRGRRRHRETDYCEGNPAEGEDDEVRRGAMRQARKRERYYDAGSSGDEAVLGARVRREGRAARQRRVRQRRRGREHDRCKLWPGAHADGWRVHDKGGAHYAYVSPGGDRFGNKADAFLAAGRELPAPPPKPPPRPPRPPPEPRAASRQPRGGGEAQAAAGGVPREGVRQSTRESARRASDRFASYADVGSEDEDDEDDLLPALPSARRAASSDAKRVGPPKRPLPARDAARASAHSGSEGEDSGRDGDDDEEEDEEEVVRVAAGAAWAAWGEPRVAAAAAACLAPVPSAAGPVPVAVATSKVDPPFARRSGGGGAWSASSRLGWCGHQARPASAAPSVATPPTGAAHAVRKRTRERRVADAA